MKMVETLKKTYRKTGQIYGHVNRMIPSIKGTLLGNKIAAYWWTGCVNFGDLLTPVLLKQYGFTPVYHPIEQSQLLSTGSILNLIPEDYAGHIVGSGLIDNTTLSLRKAKFWALRGKLTQERLGAPKQTVLGDPGLLSSKLLKHRQRRHYALGIVPHYCDKN